MGIFDSKTTLEKTIRDISFSDYEFSSELSSFNFSQYLDKYRDEELLSYVIRNLCKSGRDFSIHMDFVTNMFTSICLDRNNPDEKNLFRNMFDLYLKNEEIFIMNKNFDKVINAFDDKKIVFEYFKFFLSNDNILENSNADNLSTLMDYISEARQYYIDDRALLSSAITLIRNFDPVLLKYGDLQDVKRIIERKLDQDKKANGIYDIDEARLAEMDKKIDIMVSSGKTLEGLIETSEHQIKIMKKEVEIAKTEMKQARINEVSELQKKSTQIIKEFTASYLELMSQQRSTLVDEKDMLLQDVNGEIEKKKAELLSLADNVGKRITLELGRVTNVTNESVQRLKDFVDNNEEIKKMISDATTNDELLSALSHVVTASNQVGVPIPIRSEDIKIPRASEVFVPQIYVPGTPQIVEPERPVENKINYYFDTRVPFSDRFAELMSKKEQDIKENGTIYHENFDDLLKIVMVGKKPPYMIGPSGCGKTFVVEEQIAKLLGLKVVTDSYVTFEQAVVGYTNSGNGAYVPTNFYRCYKYGDIYFLDEIDNGIANATIILNKFMGNSNTSFTFPDGITINRHPNFRIIAAGNTKGSGRTLAYNTRQKLDEATLQRMTPIEFNYDNRIEMRILQEHEGWYDFAINFRKAIEKIPSDSGEEINSMGTFTTRDAESIKTYLDDKVFDDRKIMLYEIVETKDQDYLSKIGQHMSEQCNSGEFTTTSGERLLETYLEVCEEKKEKAKCKTM